MNPNPTKKILINPQISSNDSGRQRANWDLQNAFRNYSTLVVTQFVIAFFSFASVWLSTHYLGTEGYGEIIAVIAAAQVAQIFVIWSVFALARYGVEEFVESGSINKCFWARTLIFLPNTIIFLAFSFLWLPLLSGWLKLPPEAAWFVVIYFIVMAFWSHVQHALTGAKLPRVSGILLAIERVLIFVILLILIGIGKLNYLSAILAYIVSPLLMVFAGLFQLRHFISWHIELDFAWLKKIFKFSIPLIPTFFVGYLSSNYIDAIFISQYLPKSDLGIYSIAYQINGIFLQFPLLAGSLLMPLFVTLKSNKGIEKIEVYIQDILPLLTLSIGFGVISAVFLMDAFMPYIFGQTALKINSILLILSLSTVFAAPCLLGYIPYFQLFSASYIGTINALVAATINVTANFILIPRYGLQGSAWATVLSQGIGCFVVLIIVHRKFALKHKWTIPALIPSVIGIIYASWSGNLLFAILLVFVLTIIIIFLYKKLFMQSLKLLLNYRKLLMKQ